ERQCEASAERSSSHAIDEARGHCSLHHHVQFNRTCPANIPAFVLPIVPSAVQRECCLLGPCLYRHGDRSLSLVEHHAPVSRSSRSIPEHGQHRRRRRHEVTYSVG
ncbi:hypothetical protein, partial [Streptomyces sp. NRRL WC-3723]|uniref:hypothetical protein n=1 Tax=Streptomyces sp. NRRL WC-3723 TaxID=1519491 RepID=UPI001F3B1871